MKMSVDPSRCAGQIQTVRCRLIDGMILLISVYLIASCHEPRVADLRDPCRSDVDCELDLMSCLPLYAGEKLTSYCDRAPCPELNGFERFSDQRAMVKVCDYDRDDDGLADVSSTYKPLDAERVGERDIELLFSERDGLIIPGLFRSTDGYNADCAQGLEEVVELEICLTPLSSARFCDRDSDCDSTEYCEVKEAQCSSKLGIGSLCTQSSECMSDQCTLERCVDGALASRCISDQDCDDALQCTGQQSAAPNFSPTQGARVCGDAITRFSPCDPALLPCDVGTCIQVEFGRYGSACQSLSIYRSGGSISCGESQGCLEVCERLSGMGEVFVCVE